jgi:acyl-homoserine lactone synthase
VIGAENRHLYAHELDQHYRTRRDLRAGEPGCGALDDGDVDPFDYPEAIYFLGIEPGAGVVSGTRILPTWKPTVLSAVLPMLANVHPLPSGPDVYEWTRLFVARSHQEDHRLALAEGAVLCGMLEFCLAEGIHTMRSGTEAWWMPRIMALGWRPRALGLPLEHEGLTLAGFSFLTDEDSLAETQRVYGIERTCLVRRGLPTDRSLEIPHAVRH